MCRRVSNFSSAGEGCRRVSNFSNIFRRASLNLSVLSLKVSEILHIVPCPAYYSIDRYLM